MYDFLVEKPVIAAVFAVVVLVMAIYVFVKVMQGVGLERIRAYVYKKFVEAEHEFQHGDNEKKFEYVMELAKKAIPYPFGIFITESFLRKVIQTWFDICKDLLDDGKINGSRISNTIQ